MPLVTLGQLPGHNKENFPPLFGLFFFFIQVVYLLNFPLWDISFLLHNLGIIICVVRVEVSLDMGAGINGGMWVHNLL